MTQLDHSDYHVEKSVAAAAGSGTDVTFDVTFEPSSVGDTRAVLLVSSPSGGDYTFPLTGVCLPPKPQVPFPYSCKSHGLTFIYSLFQVLKFLRPCTCDKAACYCSVLVIFVFVM